MLDKILATDDCGIVKNICLKKNNCSRREEVNMKLTYPEDTYILDKLFQLRSGELTNIKLTKEHLAGKVMFLEVLVLGNVLLIWQLLMMLKYIAFRERKIILIFSA
jgi:hypothetical protein